MRRETTGGRCDQEVGAYIDGLLFGANLFWFFRCPLSTQIECGAERKPKTLVVATVCVLSDGNLPESPERMAEWSHFGGEPCTLITCIMSIGR